VISDGAFNRTRVKVVLNHLMGVVQERDPELPENCLEFAQPSVPVFMISQRGEGAVTDPDACSQASGKQQPGLKGSKQIPIFSVLSLLLIRSTMSRVL